jgi:hypothetical protein
MPWSSHRLLFRKYNWASLRLSGACECQPQQTAHLGMLISTDRKTIRSLQLRAGGLVLLLRRLSKARVRIERPPFANSCVQPFSFSRRNSDRDQCRRTPRYRCRTSGCSSRWFCLGALRDRREMGPGRAGSREHRQDEDARNWLPKRYFLSSPYLVE